METENLRVALLDDGELDDVRALLCDLGVPHADARRATVGERVPLLFSTPGHARALAEGRAEAPPCVLHVVIGSSAADLDGRGHLQLLRPLDASVIRLLTRREPPPFDCERRLATRVAMGIPVKIRVGEDCREVIVTKISVGGCGLVSPARLREGSTVEIAFPPEIGGRPDLVLGGTVLSAREVTTADGHDWDVSVAFDDLDWVDRVTLRAMMARHAIDYRPNPGRSGRPERSLRERALPLGVERRVQPRRRFHQRVMGICGGVGHVLMARDLSREGLRIEFSARLAVGDDVSLVVFGVHDAPPLLARAVVERDDDASGVFLRFVDLPAELMQRVDALLGNLAPLDLDPHSG